MIDIDAQAKSRGPVNRQSTLDRSLRDAILAGIPSIRAFAISLTNNIDQADDLVQETIAKALRNISRFEPGTNMSAWLFTILRNEFYSQYRKRRHEVSDPDGTYAEQLRTPPEQHSKLDFQDLQAALARLPVDQREAIILVGAQGLTYDEVAEMCAVPVGTIKSRVNRARARLAKLLVVEDAEDLGLDPLTQAALQDPT
jgi:RNA polymerase sigma-70 factor, ECF subfamily